MKPAIRADGLSKRYEIGAAQYAGYRTLRESIVDAFHWSTGPRRSATSIWALEDVSFEIQPGEILGIIGRNGAGKSTLLKILSRITEPTRGRAEVRGRIGSLLEVGTGFHPELTGRENIYLNGAILGMSRGEIARAFDQIVAFAEVDAFVDTPVKRYSSGMYVRLAFAVAAHLRSDILLVDEVLAVGDVGFRRKCIGQMSAVSKEGRTIIFVSHNMGAVRTLCRSCLLLENGTLSLHAATEGVLDEYLRRLDQSNETPLAERQDREGNGDARITSLTILDHDGEPCSEMYAGRSYTFTLTYACRRFIPQAAVAIGFLSPTGGPLFQLNNTFVDSQLSLKMPAGQLHCQVPRLPLNSGLYQVNVLMKGAGEIYDHVQAALYVNVVQDDFYGSGVMPSPSVGAFLIDHSWTAAAQPNVTAPA